MDTAQIAAFYQETASLHAACGDLHPSMIARIAQTCIDRIDAGGKILLCGNGGSASMSLHIAAELVNKLARYRRALPAISLCADIAALTSIGNDLDFDHIFSRQVEALGRPEDLFWGLSTSGASANVIAAMHVARQRGMTIVAFTGPADSLLAREADLPLTVAHTDSARIQEVHLCAGHAVCACIEQHYLTT